MHGGMKFYRGSPSAARTYVEQDRSRADDYYLAPGSGVATRHVASPLGGVSPAGSLTGEIYEKCVAGYDIETGAAKGRLRSDAKALRLVEVVVNGPKTWSLAAVVRHYTSRAGDPHRAGALLVTREHSEHLRGACSCHGCRDGGPGHLDQSL